MQHDSFTDLMQDHVANRQRPDDAPEHLLDQVDAAALHGARSVDSVARAGRQVGALVEGSVVPPLAFNRFGERYGDPITELPKCAHLTATPIQPHYVHGAALDRAFCEDCLSAFFLDNHDAFGDYDSSTDCDACGSESKVENLHVGNLSNGMVTYIVTVCTDCLHPHR